MVRRLEDDAEREWGIQMESGRMEAGTGRDHGHGPGGGVSGDKGRRWSQESGERSLSGGSWETGFCGGSDNGGLNGRSGGFGGELQEGARKGWRTRTGSKNAEVAGMLRKPSKG